MAVGPKPVPVSVLSGYLGAGKTTVLNHLLQQAAGLRIAVIVNDFGRINVDAALVDDHQARIIPLAGGCVCCRLDGNFASALMELRDGGFVLDHVIVEASGVALPSAIGEAVPLIAGFYTAAIIVVMDLETIGERTTDRYVGDLVRQQLTAADIIIANKQDLAEPGLYDQAIGLVRALAPLALIIPARFGQVPATLLRDLSAPMTKAKRKGAGLSPARNHHAEDVFQALTWQVEAPVDVDALGAALAQPSQGILRAKGFLRDLNGTRVLLQVAGRRHDIVKIGTGDLIKSTEKKEFLICVIVIEAWNSDYVIETERKFQLTRIV
jgi:G3E family GTPase